MSVTETALVISSCSQLKGPAFGTCLYSHDMFRPKLQIGVLPARLHLYGAKTCSAGAIVKNDELIDTHYIMFVLLSADLLGPGPACQLFTHSCIRGHMHTNGWGWLGPAPKNDTPVALIIEAPADADAWQFPY